MKMIVVVQNKIEINTDEKFFSDLYERHINGEYNFNKDYIEAIERIEDLTKIKCFSKDIPDNERVIVGVYAEDDTPILEF